MKLSEQWLREWVNPSITREELRTKLTMAGLEVESLSPVAQPFSNVVVAEVIQVEKHPEADRLKVCQVNVGQPELLTIVCGAANVEPGIKVPAALVGATEEYLMLQNYDSHLQFPDHTLLQNPFG